MSKELTFFPHSADSADEKKSLSLEKALQELMAEVKNTLSSLEKTTTGSLIPAIEKKADASQEYIKNYKVIGGALKDSSNQVQELAEAVTTGHSITPKS
jgi:hypothetical protein